jgi:glycosyltransferase involved in cell wall biosynthesis
MKRILYSAFDLVPSPKGAGTHITYFVRGLVKAGFDVTLITAGDPALPEQSDYHGATLLRARAGADLNFLKRAIAFGEYTLNHVQQATPFDLAHFRSIWSGFPLAQAKGRYRHKLLYEVNGLPSIEMKYHYPALAGEPVLDKLKEQEIATLHLADAIICPSKVTAVYIASLGVPPEKVTVIPNGIDTALFQPNGNIPDTAPAETPSMFSPFISPPLPTLLYIGTLADWQGLGTLINALPGVLEQQAVRLRLVGLGRKRQRKLLQKRVLKMGLEPFISIEPAIPHDHIPALIAQADVCLAPLSYNDRNVTQGCCPLKILEYMGCGKAIVASNLPVVRELVLDGREALLFAPDDPDDLARKILTVLNDSMLARQLGANAQTRAHTEFTWQGAQARLLAVYESLLR